MVTKLKVEIVFKETKDNKGRISLKNTEGKEIGHGSWYRYKRGKALHISGFRIEKYYKRKGYGNFLVRIIIVTAKFLGVKVISLTDGATVKGFWQKLGFIPFTGTKYYGDHILKVE